MAANAEAAHLGNLSAVLRRLHQAGPASRSELVRATGLSRSAVRAVIGELVELGLAHETKADATGLPGRPSPVASVEPQGAVALAVEIAVDSMAVAIVGLGGAILAEVRTASERGSRPVAETVGTIANLSRQLLESRPTRDRLVAVAVGVAGVVRGHDGFVHLAPNLGWRNVPVGALIADALDLRVPVFIANDADLGALAEHVRGAGVGVDEMVYLSGEVGVGGGVIVRGQPLRGVNGYAGEVGHIPVNPNGRSCHCGSFGCLETEVGEDALLRRAGRTLDEVFAGAEQGSTEVLAALSEVGAWLGIGAAALVNVFNPRLLVFGGLFARMFPHVLPAVRRELERRALPMSTAQVELVPAALGAEATLLGAGELALGPLLDDPGFARRFRRPVRDVAAAAAVV